MPGDAIADALNNLASKYETAQAADRTMQTHFADRAESEAAKQREHEASLAQNCRQQ